MSESATIERKIPPTERIAVKAKEARRVLSMPLLMKGDAPVTKALKMLDEALGTQDEGKT